MRGSNFERIGAVHIVASRSEAHQRMAAQSHGYHRDMHSVVILIHKLPDGSSHFDWLIEDPGCQSEHRLIAFRCAIRPDVGEVSSFTAVRLSNHRAAYLTYEGSVSNNRGSVEHVALGDLLTLEQSSDSFEMVIRWTSNGETMIVEYRGVRSDVDQACWIFESDSSNSSLDG